MEVRVDKNQYHDRDLLLIKTALHLPYYTNSIEYQRTYGSVNVNGVAYQYVKRRIFNDSLELLCLPNGERTALQSVKNDLVKNQIEGQQSNRRPSNQNNLKICLPEFLEDVRSTIQSVCSLNIRLNSNLQCVHLTQGYIIQQDRPPQFG